MLKELPSLYEKSKGRISAYDAHLKILHRFDEAREYLNREPVRNWENETALKAAYNSGLAVLNLSFDAYIAGCSTK